MWTRVTLVSDESKLLQMRYEISKKRNLRKKMYVNNKDMYV